jgi:uncharacterized membrane protein
MIAILQLSRSRKIILSIVLLPGTLVVGYVPCFAGFILVKYADQMLAESHVHVYTSAWSANGEQMALGTTIHNWSLRLQKSEAH